MINKNLVRQQKRAARMALSSSYCVDAALVIKQWVLQWVVDNDAKKIALYSDSHNEVQTQLLMAELKRLQVQLFLPVVQGREMNFYPYTKDNTRLNRFGIVEPNPVECSAVVVAQLNAVFLPLVAFDAQCNRIGRGGGFYDKALAEVMQSPNRPLLIGLAYECQRIDHCYPEQHDVPLDCIVTEGEIYSSGTGTVAID